LLHILKRGSKSKHKRLAKNSDKDPTNKLTNWIQERNQMGSLRLSHTKELANNRCRTTESNYVFCNRSGCHNSLSPLKHCKPTRGDKREKKQSGSVSNKRIKCGFRFLNKKIGFCFVLFENWLQEISVWWGSYERNRLGFDEM
jgi:hypothetical protein